MGLFGSATKRKPVERATSRPNASFDAPKRTPLRPTGSVAGNRDPAGVEVSEFNLDDEDFSSMFGSTTSQFADAPFERDEGDPWSSKRRLD